MWPHKEGLGGQLGYGVNGNGLIRHNPGKNPPYQLAFPRRHSGSQTLYRAVNSKQTILPQQMSDFDLNSIFYKDLESFYVPEEILKSYLVESKSLTSPLVYDPTFGELFQFHDIRMKKGKKYEKVLAYVSGETGTILNISIVEGKEKKLTNGSKIYLPQLCGPTFQVSLSEPIKQIQFSKLEETFDYIPSHLIVRTDSTVYVLDCLRTPASDGAQSSSGIELSIIDELHNSKLYGQTFADVSFNPWDYTQFGAVDVRGNFGIWTISTNKSYVNKLTLVMKDSEIVPDVEELSNWKKICWAFNRSNLFIGTRSSLTQITIGPSNGFTSTKLITSNSWSMILDFRRCSEFAFLLTSKELIWLYWNKGKPSRILSWKHFLDERDPSFKLQVTKQEGKVPTFLLLVFSQTRLLLFIYTFAMKDGAPYSLHDPYYIRVTTGLQQVELKSLDMNFYHPLDDNDEVNDIVADDEEVTASSFGIFELKTNLNLTMDILTTSPDVEVMRRRGSVTTRVSLTGSNTGTMDVPRNLSSKKAFKRLNRSEAEAIASGLSKKEQINIDTVKAVQDYAFKLGNSSSIAFPFTSLMDISDEVPQTIDDISEFDLMVEQLSNYYGELSIRIINLINPLNILTEILTKPANTSNEAKEAVTSLSSEIRERYMNKEIIQFNNNDSIKQASILLGASLLKANQHSAKEKFEDDLKEELKDSPLKLTQLLSEWDSTASEDLTSISQRHLETEDARLRNWGTSQMTVPDIIPTLRLSSQPQPESSQRHSQRERGRKNMRASHIPPLKQSRLQNIASSQPSQPSQLSQTTKSLNEFALSSQPTLGLSSQLESQSSSGSHSQSNSQKRKSSSQRVYKKKKKRGGFA